MKRTGKIVADAVFVLQVLIAFMLLFENRIEVPVVLQAVGRMHPMLLHLPIGLLLVTAILLFAERYFADRSYHQLVSLLVHVTALTASLTTLMGLLLAHEGSFGSDQLAVHKWAGVALSFVCWGLLAIRRRARLMKIATSAAVVLVVITGHYGATLTHGSNFLLAPLTKEAAPTERVITDSSTVFEAGIQTILDAKCVGCHNPDKAKGRLLLTSAEGVMKGGKSGALLTPADAANSLLMERLLLPLEHDDHMPPKDKAQLSTEEIALISLWIDQGADLNVRLSALPEGDTLAQLTSIILPRYAQAKGRGPQYNFKAASIDKIEALNKPNRAVFQIARNEPALQAEFYLRDHYSDRDLEALLEVRTQLVALNLSTMPVTDAALRIVAQLENLEELNLNRTDIRGDGLSALTRLSKLKSISVTGTAVSADDLQPLTSLPALEEVFLWNTAVDDAELAGLRRKHPRIRWDSGFVPDADELLQLNPPMARNKGQVLRPGEEVVLRHSLPGTTVRYTLDGTEPDSANSPVFTEGLDVGPYTLVRARAYRENWRSSEIAEFVFFREGRRPDSVRLLTTPDKRYPGEGAITLIDGQKGIRDFYRHPTWMAFREEDLVVDMRFEGEIPEVTGVTLSFAHSPGSLCFPPAVMELWGGTDPDELALLRRVVPDAPKPPRGRIEGMHLPVPASRYPLYRLVAHPVRTLPNGNPNNYDLWLMVDELYVH